MVIAFVLGTVGGNSHSPCAGLLAALGRRGHRWRMLWGFRTEASPGTAGGRSPPGCEGGKDEPGSLTRFTLVFPPGLPVWLPCIGLKHRQTIGHGPTGFHCGCRVPASPKGPGSRDVLLLLFPNHVKTSHPQPWVHRSRRGHSRRWAAAPFQRHWVLPATAPFPPTSHSAPVSARA